MMAENSKIEWTDHTFNPWMGCTRVSPGCQHCYAETMMDQRYGKVKWGPEGTRVRTSAAYWRQPFKWNKQRWWQCDICGARWNETDGVGCSHNAIDDYDHAVHTRQRVFCASLADVFEDRPDTFLWRDDLFHLIEQTPNLDWLLLTKRPENVKRSLPNNVWLGVSVENQKYADERIPILLNIPAKVRFLSCEPLLRKVNLGEAINEIHWVICGGESGPKARPMHPNWTRSLRGQCLAAKVPFFFKQWGEWEPVAELYADDGPDKAFEMMDHWVAQVEPDGYIPVMSKFDEEGWHEFQPAPGSWFMAKTGKKNAGRLLDGQEWSQFPT